MKLALIAIISFSLTFSLFSQYSTKERPLNFHSDFEAQVLKNKMAESEQDYLNFFLATSAENDSNALKYIQLELVSLYARLVSKKFGKKSAAKAKSVLEEELTANFFKKHDDFASFEQLFKTGTYNEATRTALCVLVFEHFKIPFTIHHDRHLMCPIFVLEGKKKTVFDSPVHDEEKRELFDKNYLNILKNLNFITENEANAPNEKLFVKYYMPGNKGIDVSQLVGDLYYTEALKFYEKKDYVAALNRLQKADLLYPLSRNMVIRSTCLFQLAKQVDYKKIDGMNDLFVLYNKIQTDEVKAELLRVFTKVADYQIVEKKNPDEFTRYYQLFLSNLGRNAEFLTQIDRIYFVKTAQYYARIGKRDSLVKYIDLLYKQWPNEKAVQIVLGQFLMETLEKTVDYTVGIEALDTYVEKYPFLEYDKTLQDRRLFFTSLEVRHFFENEQESLALKALANFEKFLAKYGQVKRSNLWMTTVYTSAATYYFQKRNYAKAREITNKALQLMPNSSYFAHRKEVLEGY